VLGAIDLGHDGTAVVHAADAVGATRPVPLAEAPLFESISGWRVALVDAHGRSVGQLVVRERWTYGSLIVGMLTVMIVGLVVVVRAAARATELSRMRSEFVANVSHELKTPLALIRMFGETLESGIVSDDRKRQEFYGVIRRESERLTHLINNVLDIGRIDADTKRYAIARGNLVETVREAVDAYRPLFGRLGFRVETAFPDAPIELPLDREAIVQALVNLFQNVIKYSDDHPFVGVSVVADAEWARVSVTDHGVGIPANQIPRIFEPYYRVAAGASPGPPGSGLGLSIVKHAMAAHGGRVDVASTPGRGSSFTLVLPMMAAHTPAVGHEVSAARAEA
jgi:signal transduction histidine kinase